MVRGILILFLLLPLLARADDKLGHGLDLYNAKDYRGCMKYFGDLVRDEKQNALYWFNYGNCAYMAGKYAKAFKAHRHVVLMNSKLSPAARLYAAKSLAALGQNRWSTRVLQRLLELNPPPGIAQAATEDLKSLNKVSEVEQSALDLYRAGNYADAEKKLAEVSPDSLSVDGRMLLGIVQLKERKGMESESTLRGLLIIPITPERRTLAQDLIADARRGEFGLHRYWLYVDGSAGWTSNAFIDGRSITPVSSPIWRTTLATGYHLLQGQPLKINLGYIMNYEDPTNAPELKTLTNSLEAPMISRWQGYEFTFTPFFQDIVWDGMEVGQRTGASMRISTMKDEYEVGGEFEDDSLRSTNGGFGYFHGNSYYVKPYIALWGKVTYYQAYWIFGEDGTNDIVYPDQTVLPLTQDYHGPAVRVVWHDQVSSIFATLAYLIRNFKDPALPENKLRLDDEFDATVKYNRNIRPGLSAYGLFEYVHNDSTLGPTDVRDKNFEVYTLTTGIAWDVF